MTTARKFGTTRSLGVKEELDKFYTCPAVAKKCLTMLDLTVFDRIIEPSAGSGVFSDLLLADNTVTGQVLAFDVHPENTTIAKKDWFSFSETLPGRTLVVGNPPFGRQHSLALRFINHAFETVGADTVAFILPKGFRKRSTQERIFRNATLTTDESLPRDSFTLHGNPYNLPAVFHIWERTPHPRPQTDRRLSSEHVTFVRQGNDYDFIVRRVGGRAGKASMPNLSASPQSNYFIKLDTCDVSVEDTIELVNTLTFPGIDDTTGPKSLSKSEFVDVFDPAFTRLRKP